MSLVLEVLERLEELKRKKAPWFSHWQMLGEYIHQRKQDFQVTREEGEFLSKELFDNTASDSNNRMAAALLGLLWPNGAKSFRITQPRGVKGTRPIKEHFEFVSEEMAEAMDDPKAGLAVALDEYMKDQGAFGTSGLSCFEGTEVLPLVFKAWSVKEIYIDEGPDRYVDTVYIEQEFTVRQVVAQYGLKKVSEKTRLAFEGGKKQQTVKILIAIEKRLEIPEEGAQGNLGMPWRSCHIETEAKHLLKESGYEELPVLVGRFWKLIKEIYGRSPGMAALPDVLELNALWESITVASEKALDPPLGVLDDGRLGSGTIDTSAGAINVFNITGRAGERQPVFPLFTIGEFQHAEKLIERRTESVANHFFIDALLDLNNEKEMTAYETAIRNKLRGSVLSAIFARQIAEIFTPLIERSFNVLFRMGRLGVIKGSIEEKMKILEGEEVVYIPDQIAQLMVRGKPCYTIKYVTPASRIMEAEEAQGILETWDQALKVAGADASIMDNLNSDLMIRQYGRMNGTPTPVFRSVDEVEEIRQARQKMQEAAAQAAQAQAMAAAGKDAGTASNQLAKAQEARQAA